MTGRRDDRGSMPMVLLVMLVGLTFGALLIPMIISQDRTTRFDVSRTHSLHAAEGGIDVGLGLIRSSATSDAVGDTSKLPCGPISGDVGAGTGTYTLDIAYYEADPAPHTADSAWLAENKMLCITGYGPYNTTTGKFVPSFALLTSTGSDGPGVNGASPGRTIQSTYVVKTTNSIIAGGIIRIFPDGSGEYCLDAGDVRTQGAAVAVRGCDDARKAAQSWTYNFDRSIQLASSVVDASAAGSQRGNGLCLDAAAPHQPGNPLFLGWCAPKVEVDGSLQNRGAPWNQQWNSDDNQHLRGSQANLSGVDASCITVPSPRVSGQALTLEACKGGISDTKQTWVLSASAGSGGATSPDPLPSGFLATAHQLVNFQQFGRCLDVPSLNVNSTYLIAQSCKQNPNPNKVTWNQKFALRSPGTVATGRPDTGQWETINGGSPNTGVAYCLTSTRKSGEYVVTTKCADNVGSSTTWTTYLTLDGGGNELPYSMKYTIVDSSGLCLGLGPSTDLHNGAYYKVVTAVCDGSTAQKWNALPNLQVPQLQNTLEVPFRPTP